MSVASDPAHGVLNHLREHRQSTEPSISTESTQSHARDLRMAALPSSSKRYAARPSRPMNTTSFPSTATARGKLPDPLPLVGRTAELADLEALLENRDHGTSVVFLRGEGGVGKSRLVFELAERANRRSWQVATGRSYPVETGVPYALFSDAWLPILREMDPNTPTVLSRGGDAELRYLFPSLGAPHDDLDGMASGGGSVRVPNEAHVELRRVREEVCVA